MTTASWPKWTAAALCAATIVAAGGGTGLATEIDWRVQLFATNGTYGTSDRSNTAALQTEIALRGGGWRLELSLPFLWQDEPGLVFTGRAGPGGVPVPLRRSSDAPRPGPGGGNGEHATSGNGGGGGSGGGGGPGSGEGNHNGDQDAPFPEGPNHGIGDPLLHGELRLLGGSRRPELFAFAAVKAPVADADEGFSTGHWDAGGGVRLVRSAGRVWWSAEIGAWRLGDDDDFPLRDPLTLAIQGERQLSRNWWAGVAAWGASEVVPGLGAVVETGLMASRSFDRAGVLRLRASGGLTDAAPDAAVSLEWSRR